MPRAVRNFWLSAEVDGRRSLVTGGPRGKDGGITVEEGSIIGLRIGQSSKLHTKRCLCSKYRLKISAPDRCAAHCLRGSSPRH